MKKFFTIVFLLIYSAAEAQTNDCAAAPLLPINTTCIATAGSTNGFTQSVAAISCQGFTGNANDDGWYRFVATNSELTIIVDGAANMDAVVDVRQGACNGTTFLCADATLGNGIETITYNNFTVGTTYYIRVYDFAGGGAGWGDFTICIVQAHCSDGVRNQGETDVDCGGPCPACTGYNHPLTGIAMEYVGACMVNTCSGTYRDNGGAAGNYSDNINGSYRVFCPTSAFNCVRATFTSFNLNDVDPFCTLYGYALGTSCCDMLWITNSATQNGTLLWGGCGTALPPVITSTSPSGCLSFRFWSDNIINNPGWAATLSCVPCAGGPNGTDNNDCTRSTQICNNFSFNANSSGPGLVSEGCGGNACMAGGENHSNWYVFQVNTPGTLAFTLTPTNAADDYDFALYGPGVTCSNLGPAVRCSDSYLSGATGLGNGAVDWSENVLGDKWVAPMNVTAGQIYYLVVDEWTPTNAGYNVTWTGTAGFSCTPLPVELLHFNARYNRDKKAIDIEWMTASEKDNDYFLVEKGVDGSSFEPFLKVNGSGTSSQLNEYSATDVNPYLREINYYRLKQVDMNGASKYSDVVAVVVDDPMAMFTISPNPVKDKVEIHFYASDIDEPLLKISNHHGQTMFNQIINAKQGFNDLSLSLLNLKPGLYLVSLSGKDGIQKARFVKE
jgi:hypothetical protein